MAAQVDEEKCIGCTLCREVCPQEAITLNDIATVDPEKCTDCGACVNECPNEAISIPDLKDGSSRT